LAPNKYAPGHVTDRTSEWFVPAFGSPKFRFFVGMLFLPYTGMVIAFTVVGAMLAETIYWDRVLATAVVYFLGLGIAAHALDAAGSKEAKPWGTLFTKAQLWLMAVISLIIAYLIAIYYMVLHVPFLWIVAVLEGFFVFAYNLEWFGGKLHTDAWFAFSWGFLPVCAGYIMQTNRISLEALALAGSMALFSRVEIKASRPYKSLKRKENGLNKEEREMMQRYEAILKSISIGVLLLGAGLLLRRAFG
jgi:hypothetical protein